MLLTRVRSEYASGFAGPVASYLAAPPSPRDEGNIGQASKKNLTLRYAVRAFRMKSLSRWK